MKVDKNEQNWDKLLHIILWAGTIPVQISIGIRMSQRPIPCWNGWQIPAIFEKEIRC